MPQMPPPNCRYVTFKTMERNVEKKHPKSKTINLKIAVSLT